MLLWIVLVIALLNAASLMLTYRLYRRQWTAILFNEESHVETRYELEHRVMEEVRSQARTTRKALVELIRPDSVQTDPDLVRIINSEMFKAAVLQDAREHYEAEHGIGAWATASEVSQ
jgi:hypothetical protein